MVAAAADRFPVGAASLAACLLASCGGGDAGPATTTCNKPCPFAGWGCIPYSPPLCWGLEGCMSAGY